jgi:CRISPR-associated endonuclease/helicase Cas3
VFRNFLGQDAILEHHSNFEPIDKNGNYNSVNGDADNRLILASENWDVPIIVTTTIQFYESFFANKSSRNRKLHNIANSVIILDEVQNIPTEYLYPCIELLKELSFNYKCSTVLCSATQPSIQYRNDLDGSDSFKRGLKDVREIVADPHDLAESLKRVETQQIPETSNIEIASRLASHDRVLCIVNTKRHAKELYALIGKNKHNYHLSTNMCPVHRKKKFEEIRKKLSTGEPCRVISTQLIEAGVDIDFPIVYRAMAGLDSIAQAAGRCNREGKLDKGHVYIFNPGEIKLQGHLLQTAQEAKQVIQNSTNEILTLDNIEEYFKNLFWIKGDDELDKHKIIDDIRAGVAKINFPFKSISEKFKLIDNDTKPIIIPFVDDDNEAKALIRKIDYHPCPRLLMRKLQKYTVNVYAYQWAKIFKNGGLDIKGEIFPILIREDLYSDGFGLDVDNIEINPEDLVV